jgi:hypothetical protein
MNFANPVYNCIYSNILVYTRIYEYIWLLDLHMTTLWPVKDINRKLIIGYAPARVYGGQYAWFCKIDKGTARQRVPATPARSTDSDKRTSHGTMDNSLNTAGLPT